MALRAKKPEVNQSRFKALLYADKGAGKTHFCCSFPDSYYIDTEGLEDYEHFVNMIKKNNGDLIYLTEMSEIIKEVKDLLSIKHNYKTVIIDSVSFPYAWLAQMEAERLAQKSPNAEGTEFGANLAKAKRLTFQLGMLLSRLDMNVIVVAHEKSKFIDNKDAGKTYDVNEKMAYSLGSVLNMRLYGKSRKLFIEKSRYTQLKTGDTLDFDDGYQVIENLFGREIFAREAKVFELASVDQVNEINRLIELLKISDETVQKWKMSAKTETFETMDKEKIQKCIEHLNSKLKGEAA
jgi:hypothetical protein